MIMKLSTLADLCKRVVDGNHTDLEITGVDIRYGRLFNISIVRHSSTPNRCILEITIPKLTIDGGK